MLCKRNIYQLSILVVIFTFGSICHVFANTESRESLREETLILGVISSNPKKAFKRAQPFVDYLAENLAENGIQHGRVVVAKDIRQMVRWIKNDQVDLVSETVFAAQELIQNSNAELLARRWKSGTAQYHSLFFSRSNNGVDSLHDLLGKTIVFEDEGSTSAFLIPAAILLEQGYDLYELSSPREYPPKDKVGYFFSDAFSRAGGEENMMSWVHRNIVAASAFSNIDWNKEVPDNIKDQFQVIHTSSPFPRSLMMVRPTLPIKLKQSLLSILLSAHESENGRKALTVYKKTKKFDVITPEIESSLSWAKKKKKLIDEYFSR